MNAEKKLGLAFVGILGVAFCGVLTMRLLEANKAEQIDINVGGPAAAAPQFDPTKNETAKLATPTPATPAAPTPPEAPRFANNTNAGATNTAGGRPSSYLPPLPKTPTPPAGDSRYATGAAAPFGAMPPSNATASTTSPPAATQGNPYASTASRYGSPAAAASTAGQAQAPTAPTGMTASPPYGTTPSAAAGNVSTGSRYGTPSSPTAPPSFSAATPTAAATLTPAAATSGSPYGTPTSSGATSGLNPSPTVSSVGSDNPLRGSSPSAGVASGLGSSSEPSTAGRYSTPNISTSPSGNNYATSPAGIPTSSPPSTPTLASNGGGYGTPSPSAPSAPFAGAPTSATASSNVSSAASPGLPTNSLREPRAFDASAVPSQPLVASSPTAPRAPAAAPYGNTLRATADVASPVGASSGMTGERTIAPAAATVPLVAPAPPAAPAVKNTPYVVQSDDNLWNISKKVYGDGSYYRALFAYNSDRYPHAEDVRAGSVLDVPPADFLKQRYPELVSGAVGGDGQPTDVALAGGRQAAAAATSYTVREGDTLFDIARRQLGKASRWNEIYELNRASLGENLENLRPGMQLQLPQ